ncbi:MAG: asparagine--tRNA ligase [Clostridiales bacterium]|nr:asparagine--tRNA ligase [Clostridiales bacterium]
MRKIDITTIINNLEQYSDTTVTLGGWVRSIRANKNFGFMDLNDGTTFKGAQIVFGEALDNFEAVSKLNAGSSVLVEGTLVLTPENKQPYEIQASNITICSATDETYPIQKKGHSVEFLRENAYLRGRTNLFNAVFRIRNACARAIHNFFQSENFMYVNTPIITCADCEGGSDVFRVTTHNFYDAEYMKTASPESDFFGKNVFLCPTGQLEAEAFALTFSKVYTFGPTFRSENSNTARHASEFWMIEPEMAFCDLKGDMEVMEKMIKAIINHVFDTCLDELEFLDKFVEKGLIDKLRSVVSNDFAHCTYTEAISILEKNNDNFEFKVKWGIDLQSEHERYLCEKIYNKPVFVTDYPVDIKAFYMRLNEDGKTVAACDLLAPGIGEIIGGSQREERYDVLLDKINKFNLKPEDYSWYLNLRKYGSVVHSGFGLGFDRILMYITGISNIRDAQFCPRTPKNCNF